MEKHIQSIEALIKANSEIKERSPFLEVSLGGLRTALDNAREHVKAQAKAKPEAAK
jgi:hypothetical protein